MSGDGKRSVAAWPKLPHPSSNSFGRETLFVCSGTAAGQAGVERALENLRAEIERDMKLMGCRSIDQLNRDNLRFR